MDEKSLVVVVAAEFSSVSKPEGADLMVGRVFEWANFRTGP
jgi:hypothetical protein